MSLQRYINQELILKLNEARYGQLYTDRDLAILDDVTLIPEDEKLIRNQKSEVHIYSFYGDYLVGDHNANYLTFDKTTKSLLLNVGKVFKTANIQRGSYLIAVNILQDVWGNLYDEPCLIKEISPDRTELKIAVDRKYQNQYNQFKINVQTLIDSDILNNLVINFGFNKIQKIINIRFEDSVFYLKLYQPIYDEIAELDKCWFQFELADPYLDTVILTSQIESENVNYLKGPNFNLDSDLYASNSTIFKSWEDVLDANLPTSQKIIEDALSGSQVRLNFDFTSFDNFIFYSSAEERIRNLHYKVSKIEEYSSSNAILLNSTASITPYISGSIDVNNRRIDQITSTFDPFEKWVYWESSASLFTHDITGSLTPWPKRIVQGRWANHTVSSSIVSNWYSNLIASASAFDQQNINRLYWSIPEHIMMDEGSSDFITFTDMIGQHFDVLYAYIKALTQIHERDEHYKRGFSNDLSWYIGKGFGWNLQNTRQLSDLWKYKNATNDVGQYALTGSIFSTSEENQTQQIWRRIVNNLPYLLKTKGTQRSLNALMCIYGIPQTLISIKEYGGPAIAGDRPMLIENRFSYKLNFHGNENIKLNRYAWPTTSGSWSGLNRVPDTIEFSFQTQYSQSSPMMHLFSIEDEDSGQPRASLFLVPAYTYSGSIDYGYLRFGILHNSASADVWNYTSSTHLPLYNGDSWTVAITAISGSTNLKLRVASVADNLYGRLVHTSSVILKNQIISGSWGHTSTENNLLQTIYLGNNNSSLSIYDGFSGSIYGYKEYYEIINDDTFKDHVLNPRSYSGNEPTSSYYTMLRYLPLGLDNQRHDHKTYVYVSSSQPNQKIPINDTLGHNTASFSFFTGSQSYQYSEHRETHYISVPTLGGTSLHSQKIRLEDDRLIRNLSPTSRAILGKYDRDSFDTNKVAVVFSPTDQINNDIYNHSGFFELDDYVGDPQWEFEEDYPDLRIRSNEYFKKYQKRNDLNAFIRLMSVYDYSFFEQIKQLVPGRADLVAGVLIEDDVLHRNKSRLSKRPVISNHGYSKNLDCNVISQSGTYPTYITSASYAPIPEIEYSYYTASIYEICDIEYLYSYYTGSIDYIVDLDICATHHPDTGSQKTGLSGDVDVLPKRYSGSCDATQSIYNKYPLNCCYKKVINHYSASGNFSTKYLRQWYTAVSKSYGMSYSRSLECTNYQIDECSSRNYSRYVGSTLSAPGVNVDSTMTVDGGPVVSVKISEYRDIYYVEDSLRGNINLEGK